MTVTDEGGAHGGPQHGGPQHGGPQHGGRTFPGGCGPEEPEDSETLAAVRGIELELRTLVRRIRTTKAEVARSIDPELVPSAYTVLTLVADRQPTRAGEIVDVLDMDKSAISRHLATLAELGLVQRDCDPEDRRSHTVSLTERGRRKVREAVALRWTGLSDRLEGWTREDLRSFAVQLERFNRAIDGDGPDGAPDPAGCR